MQLRPCINVLELRSRLATWLQALLAMHLLPGLPFLTIVSSQSIPLYIKDSLIGVGLEYSHLGTLTIMVVFYQLQNGKVKYPDPLVTTRPNVFIVTSSPSHQSATQTKNWGGPVLGVDTDLFLDTAHVPVLGVTTSVNCALLTDCSTFPLAPVTSAKAIQSRDFWVVSCLQLCEQHAILAGRSVRLID